jgi:hypothetical protein
MVGTAGTETRSLDAALSVGAPEVVDVVLEALRSSG